jgi:hypothetical protein
MGRNLPRISSGASGLGSNVSCCAAAPYRYSRMIRLARPKCAPCAAVLAAVVLSAACADCSASNCGSESDSAPRLPACSISRRVMPSQAVFLEPRIRSMLSHRIANRESVGKLGGRRLKVLRRRTFYRHSNARHNHSASPATPSAFRRRCLQSMSATTCVGVNVPR